MSGGVDSISVGFGAHRLGKEITAYSFCLDTHTSYDYLKAKEVCEIMGWNFVGVEIPTANLVDDWYRLVRFGCVKKTILCQRQTQRFLHKKTVETQVFGFTSKC